MIAYHTFITLSLTVELEFMTRETIKHQVNP